MTSDLNEISNSSLPKNWQLLCIDDIKKTPKGAIISGPFGSNISSKYFVDDGIPVIRGNNLSLSMERFIDKGFVYLTEEKAKELNTWAEEERYHTYSCGYNRTGRNNRK